MARIRTQSRPSRLEPIPQITLTLPIRFQGDWLKICQLDRIMSPKRPRQEKDDFLDVRGQAGQVHDLADACPADLTQSGQSGAGKGLPGGKDLTRRFFQVRN